MLDAGLACLRRGRSEKTQGLSLTPSRHDRGPRLDSHRAATAKRGAACSHDQSINCARYHTPPPHPPPSLHQPIIEQTTTREEAGGGRDTRREGVKHNQPAPLANRSTRLLRRSSPGEATVKTLSLPLFLSLPVHLFLPLPSQGSWSTAGALSGRTAARAPLASSSRRGFKHFEHRAPGSVPKRRTRTHPRHTL